MAGGINERLNLFCTKRLFALVRKNVFTLMSQMDVPFDDLLHKFMCESPERGGHSQIQK